ncbi:hypothetical protein [Prosthecobacter sp.]
MILSVLVMLVAIEVFFRLAGHRLSADVAGIRDIKATAAQMAATPAPRLLFVGNSLSREGIDPQALQAGLKSAGSKTSVFMAYPDSSHALVWDYLLSCYFADAPSRPEEVILVSARIHLLDAPGNVSQMGAYYVSWDDAWRFLKDEAVSVDERVEFFLGRFFATYAMRAKVNPRVFDVLLPHYQENWSILNRAALMGRGTALSGAVSGGTTRHLRHVVGLLKGKGVRVRVLKVPMPNLYPLDVSVDAALKELDVPVIDLNPVPGISPENFPDGEHLNAAGRVALTRALVTELSRSVAN